MDVPVERLQLALEDGAKLEAWLEYYDQRMKLRRTGGIWTLRPVCLGLLPVKSGELIAGDIVFGLDMTAPFRRDVLPGEYEVWATIALPPQPTGLLRFFRRPRPGELGTEPIVAFLTLLLSDETPARYEFAALQKEPGGDRPIDEFPGFGVDSGTAGLTDAAHAQALRETPSDELWKLEERLAGGAGDAKGLAAMIELPTTPSAPAALAHSGWGDGAYLSYWGLSSAGAPVRLIVDFNLTRDAND